MICFCLCFLQTHSYFAWFSTKVGSHGKESWQHLALCLFPSLKSFWCLLPSSIGAGKEWTERCGLARTDAGEASSIFGRAFLLFNILQKTRNKLNDTARCSGFRLADGNVRYRQKNYWRHLSPATVNFLKLALWTRRLCSLGDETQTRREIIIQKRQRYDLIQSPSRFSLDLR